MVRAVCIMTSPAVRELRRVMFTVAQQLTQQESDTLVWMQGVPVEFSGKPPLTVLAQMESQGLFSASKPERFADILRDINRLDLAKQVTKITKRKKNQRDTVEQSQEQQLLQITLAANLEVTLLQSKILLEQVERLRQVVIDANEKRIGEIVGDAKESVERLKRTLDHASGLCRSKVGSTTTQEEVYRPLHEPESTIKGIYICTTLYRGGVGEALEQECSSVFAFTFKGMVLQIFMLTLSCSTTVEHSIASNIGYYHFMDCQLSP